METRKMKRLWMLATLLALLLPERAAATYVDETYNYMVTLNGSNTIRIQAPCYNQEGYDCWVSNGNLRVEWIEAVRNFSGKDVTIDLMIRPEQTGKEMPLFSHGANNKKLQLWLTADGKLKAIVNDQTFVSTDTIVC